MAAAILSYDGSFALAPLVFAALKASLARGSDYMPCWANDTRVGRALMRAYWPLMCAGVP